MSVIPIFEGKFNFSDAIIYVDSCFRVYKLARIKPIKFGVFADLLVGFFLLSVFCYLFLVPGSLNAATPTIINYQGRLQDATGTLLGGATGTTFQFRFSLWNSSAGGTRIWPSSTPATTSLLVTEGVFNAQIGDSSQGFAPLDFDFNTSSKIYLQLEIYNSSTLLYETMLPRQPIVSAGFAINADTLDGYNSGTSSNNLLLLNSAGNIDIGGGATFASRTIIAANPLLVNSSSLLRLGLNEIQGGSVAGTFLGINPSSFSGNFLDFQTNSSSQYRVSATGTLYTAGLIYSGSSNIKLTISTGFVDADAIGLTTSGTVGATSSNSGLEAISDSLSLLKGCANNEVLKWDDTNALWACGTDAGGFTVSESSTVVITNPGTISFNAPDFNVASSGTTGQISIDYASSNIVRSNQVQTISGQWTFTGASTSLQGITFTNATGTTLNISSDAQFASTVSLTANPLAQASASLFRLGPNSIQGGDTASGTYIGINPTSFSGNFIDSQTNSSSKFRVSATGTLYAAGLIYSGSSNIRLTTSTGYIDAAAIALTTTGTTGATSSNSGLEAVNGAITVLKGCANNEIMKWDETNSLWTCGSDTGGLVVNESSTVVVSPAATISFNAPEFTVVASGTIAQIGIDYSSSSIVRSNQQEIITAIWTFSTSVSISSTPLAVSSSSLLRLGPNIIQGGDSASGTYIGINPTSFAGNFLDFQTNSSSKFRVSATGTAYFAGNIEVSRVSSTNVSTTNITATSYGNVSGTNFTASGYLQGATLSISGDAVFASTVSLTASPLAKSSSSLLRLGPNIIQGGDSASGTYIGINPTSFAGNFLDFQTNSSSQFRVSATGTIYLAGNLETARVSSTNVSSTRLTVAGVSDLQGLTFTNATGTGNIRINTLMATGSVAIGTSTLTGILSIGSSTSGAVGIAGIFEDLTLNPSGGSFQFGNRMIVRNIPTVTANTAEGNFIRMIDDTTLANTVRGMEIQAYSGSNSQGVNTGLIAFGRTFGVQGITTGEAGGTLIPAGVYAELQNGTQGQALRIYSATTTSADLSLWYHEASNFTANALKMNLGNGAGNFTGNFINLQKASTTLFNIDATGTVVIASSSLAAGASSTLTVCARSNCTLSTTSTASVAWFASVDGSTSTNSIVARGSIVGNSADFGEYVPVAESALNYEAGDLLSITSSTDVFAKSGASYDPNLAGAVTVGAAFIGGLEKKADNAVVMALAGRIPIKVSSENGSIVAGDLITASSKVGIGMKATKAGRVLGMALESFNSPTGTTSITGRVLILINPHWYVPEIETQNIQGSGGALGPVLNTFNFDPNMNYVINTLSVNKLTVGSEERPTGITLFDKKTKKPYCLFVEDGYVRTEEGECDIVHVSSTLPAVSVPTPTPEVIDESSTISLLISDASSSATTTQISLLPLLDGTTEIIIPPVAATGTASSTE